MRSVSPLDINDEQVFVEPDRDNSDLLMGPMLKWIPELYKCLQSHPLFTDDKEWAQLPSIHQLAKYLISKVESLKPEANDWVIRKIYGGGLTITYFQTLHDYDYDATLSLEWLVILEEQNPYLGRLAITMMALVTKAWRLDVMDNEYTEMAIQDPDSHFTGEDEDDERIKAHLNAYEKNGAAARFKARMDSMSKSSMDKLVIELMLFVPENKKEEQIRDWLVSGVEVLDDPGVIGMFIWEPLDYDSDDYPRPITAQEMFCCYWSFHDAVYKIASTWIDGTAREGGIVPATTQRIFTSNKTKFTACAKPQLDKLARFMDKGRNIYSKYYRDFYVKLYNDAEEEFYV